MCCSLTHEPSGDEKNGQIPTQSVDLNNNVSAMIKNPLAGMSVEQVLTDVNNFADDNDLGHIRELLIKGALIAKDPAEFESVDGVTDVEKDAIRDEVLHKWRQPWSLYFTIILCSIGAAVQGWDQEGANGANLSFPDALGIPTEDPITGTNIANPNAAKNSWILGLVNAAPYIASACL